MKQKSERLFYSTLFSFDFDFPHITGNVMYMNSKGFEKLTFKFLNKLI